MSNQEQIKHPVLTTEIKLQVFAAKFYQGMFWEPKKGDYYTTTRADLELYQVVDVDERFVYTKYTYDVESKNISKWEKDKFLTHGFGTRRMWIPDYLIKKP